ncbi:MAG: PLP-dependent transferase [Candidatus Hydrogenedentes bacterium]|nr:PLP-dependent transferase [Candidatus Hydrogenedentota bacterium]
MNDLPTSIDPDETVSTQRPDEELLIKPLWRAEDLGKPIPASPHAASVAMPLWEHIVRYEQKDPALLEALQCGYPRFVFNPIVNELFRECRRRYARENELCLAFPSRRIAEKCARFLNDTQRFPSRIEEFGLNDLYVVVFPVEAFDTAKSYWQHYGNIVSSRLAQATLEGREGSYGKSPSKKALLARIAKLAGAKSTDIRIYPSGMAALSSALECVRAAKPGAKSIQLGLPYVDLLRIQTKWGPEAAFYPVLNEETFEAITWQVENGPVAAVFCEFPGNPLLQSCDIERLSTLLRKNNVPLIVDETLGSFVNVDVLPFADIVVTSLTKYFSGVGDVMAGSLVLSSASPLCDTLKKSLRKNYEDRLWDEDAAVLESNSRDFADRMQRINANAEKLCDFLHAHPRVQRVHYPKFETPANYRKATRVGAGYGGMFSLILKDAASKAPVFFDGLRVSKGPSLGTNYTLACPYTLLAHFDELDFVEPVGVSPNLVRVSVGLEPPGEIIARFKEALDNI